MSSPKNVTIKNKNSSILLELLGWTSVFLFMFITLSIAISYGLSQMSLALSKITSLKEYSFFEMFYYSQYFLAMIIGYYLYPADRIQRFSLIICFGYVMVMVSIL